MRRRERPQDDEEGGPPVMLRRFRAEEWIDRSEPIPASWPRDGIGYHGFRARRRWMDARREWARRHGESVCQVFASAPRPAEREP